MSEKRINPMLYVPRTCTEDQYLSRWQVITQANEKRLNQIERKAIKNGGLLYRFIYEGVADGQAIYQIIRVNKNTVRIRLCSLDPCYAEYVVPYWGKETTISKKYAWKQINNQNSINKLFNRKSS